MHEIASPGILYEDNHLLVVDKPAGMPTVGTTDRLSVYRWTAQYLKEKYHKPGNVFVGIVSRLDTVTSGVLVVARTSKAASRLSDQIRHGKISKTYLAVLEGHLASDEGELTDWLRKDDAAHRMRVVPESASHASIARLRYRTVSRRAGPAGDISLIQIRLLTGRKHQIRVQFAAAGHPVLGDRKYQASTPPLGHGIALHSSVLEFEHPTRREPMRFEASPPKPWRALGISA